MSNTATMITKRDQVIHLLARETMEEYLEQDISHSEVCKRLREKYGLSEGQDRLVFNTYMNYRKSTL